MDPGHPQEPGLRSSYRKMTLKAISSRRAGTEWPSPELGKQDRVRTSVIEGKGCEFSTQPRGPCRGHSITYCVIPHYTPHYSQTAGSYLPAHATWGA